MPHSNVEYSTLELISRIISGRTTSSNEGALSDEAWDVVARKAHVEGVGPLLFWTLSSAGQLLSLPKMSQNFLREDYIRALIKNQVRVKELQVLCRLFADAEIPTVALKGICFALTIYPDLGLRPMKDVDILVPKAKLAEAVEIAKAFGYEGEMRKTPALSPELADLFSHHVFLHKRRDVALALEVHHSLIADKSYTYSVRVDWFWEQTEEFVPKSQIEFKNLRMLTPTAQILYAASHAVLQHGEKKANLLWYYDLDRLIRCGAQRVDWELLIAQARIFEWGSALEFAFSKTQSYFDTPIPDNVHLMLTRKHDRSHKIMLLRRTQPISYVYGAFRKLRLVNGHRRFKLILAHFVPSPAYMYWRYHFMNPWLLPVYYLLRWCGIARNVLHTVILLLKRLPARYT